MIFITVAGCRRRPEARRKARLSRLRSITMEETAKLRAELTALRHLVEDEFLGDRVTLVACFAGFLAGCALGSWVG
jgi:hypothetical protein